LGEGDKNWGANGKNGGKNGKNGNDQGDQASHDFWGGKIESAPCAGLTLYFCLSQRSHAVL